MAWENIILLATGFALMGLNALLGSRAAAGIARLFASFGTRPRGDAELPASFAGVPTLSSDSEPQSAASGRRNGPMSS